MNDLRFLYIKMKYLGPWRNWDPKCLIKVAKSKMNEEYQKEIDLQW